MEIPTTGTVAEDDARLPYFAEALKARGITLPPEALQAFAEKKDRGETEAQIVEHADEWTRSFKSQDLTKRTLQGTALGSVIVPAADWLKEGRPSWREVVKRSPKTVAIGVLLGGGAGWAAGKHHNHAMESDLKSQWADFKHNTHEMETAWTEALTQQAAKEPAVSKDGGPAR